MQHPAALFSHPAQTGTNPLLGLHAVSPSPKSTSLALHDPLSPLVLPTNTPLLEEWAGDKKGPIRSSHLPLLYIVFVFWCFCLDKR